MHPQEKRKAFAVFIFLAPLMAWSFAISWSGLLRQQPGPSFMEVVKLTPHHPLLLGALIVGFLLPWMGLILVKLGPKPAFQGAEFRRHLRGTKMVWARELAFKTRKRKAEQVIVAGVPMPPEIEALHTMINGSTGTGKTVLLTALMYSAMLRGDRLFICDPNGEFYAKFGRKGDRILNPYDARSEGWSIFNEIRNSYDYERYAMSLIQSSTKEEEEWCGYARLLWCDTARQVVLQGVPPGSTLVAETFRWTNMVEAEALHRFVTGTPAESLFVGADRALGSARFILSKNIPPHLRMPDGRFSIRDWLEDEHAGNLYVTWREDMAEALTPLISAWVDVLCTSILSLPVDAARPPFWVLVDELASMNKLPSLEAAATKGRKAGLRLVAGLQSVSQLETIYGHTQAQTLRSCFRSLVVLGGANADDATAEAMSKALGQHEVERYGFSSNSGDKSSTGTQIRNDREPVVMASEIISLPALTGFLAFAGDFPVARFTLKTQDFATRNVAFEERPT